MCYYKMANILVVYLFLLLSCAVIILPHSNVVIQTSSILEGRARKVQLPNYSRILIIHGVSLARSLSKDSTQETYRGQ